MPFVQEKVPAGQSATPVHCTQDPLEQWDLAPEHACVQVPQWFTSLDRSAQTLPHAVRPPVQGVHEPPTHAAPETHWFAPVPEQLVTQALGPHTKGLQVWVVAVGQLPW